MKTLIERLREPTQVNAPYEPARYVQPTMGDLLVASELERLQTQLDASQTHEGKLEDLERENLRLTAELETSLKDRVALAMQVETLTAERNTAPPANWRIQDALDALDVLVSERDALRLAAQAGLDALETCRIMSADDAGNYTKEITPKVITERNEMTDKENTCKTAFGVPTERVVLERSWVSSRRTLLQCRATLLELTFKDTKIANALAAIRHSLELMGGDE